MILKEYLSKEFIYSNLHKIDAVLRRKNLYLNLRIVGGAGLIFNGITSIDTSDIDTLDKLTQEIKDICSDSSLDINDDVLDYLDNFNSLDSEFLEDNEESFSNITISYLNTAGIVFTKLKNCQDEDKMENLRFLLEDELDIEMTVKGISEYLEDYSIVPNTEDIVEFLKGIGYL